MDGPVQPFLSVHGGAVQAPGRIVGSIDYLQQFRTGATFNPRARKGCGGSSPPPGTKEADA